MKSCCERCPHALALQPVDERLRQADAVAEGDEVEANIADIAARHHHIRDTIDDCNGPKFGLLERIRASYGGALTEELAKINGYPVTPSGQGERGPTGEVAGRFGVCPVRYALRDYKINQEAALVEMEVGEIWREL